MNFVRKNEMVQQLLLLKDVSILVLMAILFGGVEPLE